MNDETALRLEPLGAFDAIVPAEPGQILSSLGVLPLLEVLGRLQVGCDLVEVPGQRSVAVRSDMFQRGCTLTAVASVFLSWSS
jgi:hypothetical protein